MKKILSGVELVIAVGLTQHSLAAEVTEAQLAAGGASIAAHELEGSHIHKGNGKGARAVPGVMELCLERAALMGKAVPRALAARRVLMVPLARMARAPDRIDEV